ncbi:hypothetical protein EC957_012387 [Mortierella hygrophila]|uniref:Uncharacterized protein n=1 Tax=Mortierella hygrophila TaxID=979708 RepID=A0A9P6F6I3_9FUNG|nr:hypothetical protein EC957_012387 [Mortierella hygrophila]
MASQDNNNDDINAAYMNMLNRNIPGVGNNPLHPTSTIAKPTTMHLSNKSTNANHTSTPSVTKNQQHAISTLQAAIKDALYISEGEEPYQTVHISPTTTTGTAGAIAATALTKNTSFPTEQEFVTLLQTSQLLPSFQQLTETEDEDEDEGNTCEKSSNFRSVLNESNPGSDKLAQAFHDIFGLPSTPEVMTATTITVVPENDKMVLYRVADPSSSTKVHIWILGWIDGDLIGLHTIAIES